MNDLILHSTAGPIKVLHMSEFIDNIKLHKICSPVPEMEYPVDSNTFYLADASSPITVDTKKKRIEGLPIKSGIKETILQYIKLYINCESPLVTNIEDYQDLMYTIDSQVNNFLRERVVEDLVLVCVDSESNRFFLTSMGAWNATMITEPQTGKQAVAVYDSYELPNKLFYVMFPERIAKGCHTPYRRLFQLLWDANNPSSP